MMRKIPRIKIKNWINKKDKIRCLKMLEWRPAWRISQTGGRSVARQWQASRNRRRFVGLPEAAGTLALALVAMAAMCFERITAALLAYPVGFEQRVALSIFLSNFVRTPVFNQKRDHERQRTRFQTPRIKLAAEAHGNRTSRIARLARREPRRTRRLEDGIGPERRVGPVAGCECAVEFHRARAPGGRTRRG